MSDDLPLRFISILFYVKALFMKEDFLTFQYGHK